MKNVIARAFSSWFRSFFPSQLHVSSKRMVSCTYILPPPSWHGRTSSHIQLSPYSPAETESPRRVLHPLLSSLRGDRQPLHVLKSLRVPRKSSSSRSFSCPGVSTIPFSNNSNGNSTKHNTLQFLAVPSSWRSATDSLLCLKSPSGPPKESVALFLLFGGNVVDEDDVCTYTYFFAYIFPSMSERPACRFLRQRSKDIPPPFVFEIPPLEGAPKESSSHSFTSGPWQDNLTMSCGCFPIYS